MRPTAAAALLAPALLLFACADDEEAVDAGSGEPAAVRGQAGGGGSPLFVEIAYVGGFVPFGYDFRRPPAVVVYDDGAVFTVGAVPEIFPGPAVVPVSRGQVDTDALDDLLAAAAEAGMVDGEPDVGEMGDIPVADAASTRVTVVVDGDVRVVEAYALDLAGMGADVGQTGLTDAQVEARERVARFVETASELALAADADYVPERYRVLATVPADAGAVDPGGPRPTEQAWPAGVPEPGENTCTAVVGDAAVALGSALRDADELTVWRLGDRAFAAYVRPVLSHEPDCETEG